MNRRALTMTLVLTALLILFMSAVKSILLPFVLGFVLAYLLNPAVAWMQRLGLPRELASAVPVAGAISLIVIGIALGMPLLIEQMSSFVQRLPVYLMTLQHFVLPERLAVMVGEMRASLNLDTVLQALGIVGTKGLEVGLNALQQGLNGVMAVFNIGMLVVMTPLVAFYLLVDWPKLTADGLNWLPKPWRPQAREVLGEIDRKLAAYLRGVVIVCLLLGTFYAVSLQLLGLEMGWAIGMLTGILAFIPVIGGVIGVTLMYAVAVVQYQLLSWEPYALLALIFAVGQLIEGYILTPKLVGNSVGLHPIWVMFALLAGATLAGILGMLLALPVAVVVSVVLPRVLDSWRKSM